MVVLSSTLASVTAVAVKNEKLISVAEELEFPKARDGDKEQLMEGMSEPEAYHHGLSYSLFPPFGLIVRVL